MTPTTRDTREPDDAEGALARALHSEWDRRTNEPSEPGVSCDDCRESAATILAALSADGWRVERTGTDRVMAAVRDWMQYGAADGSWAAEIESDRLLQRIAAEYERVTEAAVNAAELLDGAGLHLGADNLRAALGGPDATD